jgi:hypothetical protein
MKAIRARARCGPGSLAFEDGKDIVIPEKKKDGPMTIDPAILSVPFVTGETLDVDGVAHVGHW